MQNVLLPIFLPVSVGINVKKCVKKKDFGRFGTAVKKFLEIQLFLAGYGKLEKSVGSLRKF